MTEWHLGCFQKGNFGRKLLTMTKPLRILHLEDEADFAELLKSLLESEGINADVKLVSRRAEFEAAVEHEKFDLILADYLLPNYTGIDALQAAQRITPQTPFVLVSGTLAEQAAVETLKLGATDYVMKLSPERLVPAIRRAVQEADERVQRQLVETEMVRREKYFRALTENALDIVTILN